MAKDIYFQWQNDHLLRTIYPLREMKLRDFLVYYEEIDIWDEYGDKELEDIPDEVKEYKNNSDDEGNKAYKKYEELKTYFLEPDVSEDYQRSFKELDPDFLVAINRVHKTFKDNYEKNTSNTRKWHFIKSRITDLENSRANIQKEIADKKRTVRNMGPTWAKTEVYQKDIDRLENITSEMLRVELGKLNEFLAAFDKVKANQEALDKWMAQSKRKLADLQQKYKTKNWYANKYPQKPEYKKEAQELKKELDDLQNRLEAVGKLPKDQQLKKIGSNQEITIKDIARWKANIYQESLLKKEHYELLDEIVQRFLKDPQRYPLWLQYMVIHFSGMRYQSAHGSWGDPRDLLQSLRLSGIEKKYKNILDESIASESLEVVRTFEKKPVQTSDQTERDKIDDYLTGLRSSTTYRQRAALVDLRIDEQLKTIEEMSDEEVLDELQEMEDDLPDWMWKEIVARTPLRLEEVESANWEELTPEEQEEKNSYEMGQYREIMNKWKKENLTGWRNEHDRANQLVVTRAVCNEVAEHIQHLRGLTPPGGLTAKPEWYRKMEKAFNSTQDNDKPFLVKPDAPADFEVGASILWLRWVNREPNPWRIAHPLELSNGEGLLPGSLFKGGAGKSKKSTSKTKAKAAKQPTDWRYEISGDAFKRNRTIYVEQQQSKASVISAGKKSKAKGKVKKKNKQVAKKKQKMVRKEERQWLRWMHEATVAEVAETADGIVVLTFETALPYEDKSRSTIGVFKRSERDLEYSVDSGRFNGTFIGYIPEGELPLKDLKRMLKWEHVMLDPNYITTAKMNAFWAKATRKKTRQAVAEISQPKELADTIVEAMPEIRTAQHREWILCYEFDAAKKVPRVFQPRVEVARGVRLHVSTKKSVKVGKFTYYKVIQCDEEPRAQGLYVRSAHVSKIHEKHYKRRPDGGLELPKENSSRPVETLEPLNLRKITNGNNVGKPIMYPSGVKLSAGTVFRVSTVHRVTSSDAGDGVLDTNGPDHYLLITECPSRPSAKGMFTQTFAVTPLDSEEQYQQRAIPMRPDPNQELRVKVVPKEDGEAVFLFKEVKPKAGKPGKEGLVLQKSFQATLPAGVELTVSSEPQISSGKEFYRILACEMEVKYVGYYLLTKEVAPTDTEKGVEKSTGGQKIRRLERG
jgi:hypothetical protein